MHPRKAAVSDRSFPVPWGFSKTPLELLRARVCCPRRGTRRTQPGRVLWPSAWYRPAKIKLQKHHSAKSLQNFPCFSKRVLNNPLGRHHFAERLCAHTVYPEGSSLNITTSLPPQAPDPASPRLGTWTAFCIASHLRVKEKGVVSGRWCGMRAPKTVRVQSIPSLAGGNSSKEGPSGQPARNGTEGRRRRRKRGQHPHWLCASKGSSPARSRGHLLIHIPSSSPAWTASAISAEPEIRSIWSTKQGLPVWLRGDVCRTGTVVQTATTAESEATNIDWDKWPW